MSKYISPSLICTDLCNLAPAVQALENAGCEMLHVDLLDGYFSPSMPIGLDVIRQLREKTHMAFDAHVMARDNTFFMEQLADIGVQRMCFQMETETHLSRKLTWLRGKGIQAGLALAPGTALDGLEYLLEQCDFILLMMINPGYASDSGEVVSPKRKRKILELREMITRQGLDVDITIDGRTYLDVIPEYMALGANTFVAGTSSLFMQNGKTLAQNFAALDTLIETERQKLQ